MLLRQEEEEEEEEEAGARSDVVFVNVDDGNQQKKGDEPRHATTVEIKLRNEFDVETLSAAWVWVWAWH